MYPYDPPAPHSYTTAAGPQRLPPGTKHPTTIKWGCSGGGGIRSRTATHTTAAGPQPPPPPPRHETHHYNTGVVVGRGSVRRRAAPI